MLSASNPSHLRRELRTTIAKDGWMLPGVFNAMTAKIAARAGFKGLYISGAALSASLGIPDIGMVTLTEMAGMAKSIARSVTLPCICDADTGFGESINAYHTVLEMEAAGLAGIHLEDQILPKRCGHLEGKTLISKADMVRKIKSALDARSDENFMIIARTDARSEEGLKGALERAQAYADAGADAIFPEALKSADEFKCFASAMKIPLLANMTEFGVSPLLSFSELNKLGYKMVIFPVSSFRIAMKSCENFYNHLIVRETQSEMIPDMQTRQELYDYLEYEQYAKWDEKIAGYGPINQGGT